MNVRIRHSTDADVPAIARMTYESADAAGSYGHPPPMFGDERRLRDDFVRFGDVSSLVAEAGERIVGHAAFVQARTVDPSREPIAGLAHVWRLFVAPGHWGTGLARDLLQRAEVEMRTHGYTRARLFTPKAQARARAFYERAGWRATGVEERSDGLGLDLVEYRTDL